MIATMMNDRCVGVVGAGNMAQALVNGWLSAKLLKAEQVRASDVVADRLSEIRSRHGIATHSDNGELFAWADVLVLAVKPQSASHALDAESARMKKGALLVSIAAGISTEFIESRVPEHVRVVRAMPNTPALVLSGATALCAGTRATVEDVALARALFDAVGRTVVVPESQINAVTGLSGSGPAYVMLVIEALADGGVQMGLPRDVAQLLAAQTVLGSAKLLIESGEHPGQLKDRVTSPGGTTIAGIYALEAGGLRKTLMEAVERATLRADELGRRRG